MRVACRVAEWCLPLRRCRVRRAGLRRAAAARTTWDRQTCDRQAATPRSAPARSGGLFPWGAARPPPSETHHHAPLPAPPGRSWVVARRRPCCRGLWRSRCSRRSATATPSPYGITTRASTEVNDEAPCTCGGWPRASERAERSSRSAGEPPRRGRSEGGGAPDGGCRAAGSSLRRPRGMRRPAALGGEEEKSRRGGSTIRDRGGIPRPRAGRGMFATHARADGRVRWRGRVAARRHGMDWEAGPALSEETSARRPASASRVRSCSGSWACSADFARARRREHGRPPLHEPRGRVEKPTRGVGSWRECRFLLTSAAKK